MKPSSALRVLVVSILGGSVVACGGGGGGGGPVGGSGNSTPAAPAVTASPVAPLTLDDRSPSVLSGTVALSGTPANVTFNAISQNTELLSVQPSGALVDGHATLSFTVSAGTAINGTHTTRIQLVPAGASSGLLIPITVNVDRTEVSYVAPYVAVAGTSHEVVIRGAHFPAAPSVSFGTTPASNVQRISDTEIRATYPASLAVGTYPVQVSEVPLSRANLVVANTPAFAPTRINIGTAKRVTRLVYDAAQPGLYTVFGPTTAGLTDYAVTRADYFDGSWAPFFGGVVVPGPLDVAASIDGTVAVSTSSSHIYRFNANFTSLRSAGGDITRARFDATLAVANDGYAFNSGRSGTTCPTYSRIRFRMPDVTEGETSCGTYISGSADGSLLVMGNMANNTLQRYDASNSQFSTVTPDPGLTLTSRPVLDRHGKHIILNKTRVYDEHFSLLGELPATTGAVVLNPSGTVAWTYEAPGVVRKFNLAAATVGGVFPAIGALLTLPQSPDEDANGEVVMTSTPEGEFLFIGGDDGIVVQPAP